MSGPNLSFVMVVDTWETARRAADRLVAQTVASRIELVLVAPDDVAPPATLASKLAGVTTVEHALCPIGDARAAGVRAASAEVVVIGETHVFAEDDWAERLLAAHAEGWAAVTPAITNANPGSVLSAVSLHLDYGRFGPTQPRKRGKVMPRTNASIARRELMSFGADLEQRLGPLGGLPVPEGGVLHEPAARIGHLNVDRPRAWAHERYLAGRLVGGVRAMTFSRPRRAIYALAAPLVAAVIFVRAVRLLERPAGTAGHGLLGALLAASLIQAAGEAVGCVVGRLAAAERGMLPYELLKWRYASGGPT